MIARQPGWRLALTLCVCAMFVPPTGAQTNVSWSGPTAGNWSDATKWTPAIVPDNGSPLSSDTYAATIAASGPAYNVNLDIPITLDSLTLGNGAATLTQQAASTLTLSPLGSINVNAGLYRMINSTISGGTINIGPAGRFRFGGGTLVDATLVGNATIDPISVLTLKGSSSLSNSQLHLNATGGASRLELSNASGVSTTLAGNGQVVFDGISSNFISSLNSYDIAPGITVTTGTGSGMIQNELTTPPTAITNRGTISAKTAGQTITVAENFTSNVYNPGTLSASNGASLIVNKLTGDAGTLSLTGNSTLDLRGNFTINQSLTLASSNFLRLSGNFAVAQPLTANAGSKIELGGTWTNTAPVSINGATVILDTPYTHTPAAPFTVSNSSINLGGNFATASVRSFFVNHNTVALTYGGSINNNGDTLALDATTGTVAMNDAGIYGGSITATGGARLIANSGFTYLYGVDLNSNVTINSGATLSFGDTKLIPGMSLNRGTITGSGATLSLTGQWQNPGKINLVGGTVEFAGPALDMGTITVSNTAVNLKSTISTLQLGSITGTMNKIVISDQAKLDLGGGTFGPSNTTGPIYLNAGFIQNGTLVAPGANKVLTSGGGSQAFLDNITLGTDLTIVPNYKLFVRNSLTLSGKRITINNNLTEYYQRSGLFLQFGAENLGGTGEIVFDGPGSAGVLEEYGSVLTIGPGITVRTGNGSGFIAGETDGDIINQGILRADGAGKKLEFTSFKTLANTGRLEARNGGKLLFSGTARYIPNWTNDGTIHLESGGNATIIGTSFTNSKTGQIEGNGTLDVSATTFINNGTLSPGLSAGVLNITGNLKNTSDATLLIQIGGTAPASNDRLAIAGNATIAGNLAVSLINEFAPSPLQKFDIVTYATHSGEFTTSGPISAGGQLLFAPIYSSDRLTLVATLPGDATADGKVSFEDLVVVAQNYGSPNATWVNGDFNSDGTVAFDDLVAVAQNYVQPLPSAIPGASSDFNQAWTIAVGSVPEPGTLANLLLIAPSLLMRGRRTRTRSMNEQTI